MTPQCSLCQKKLATNAVLFDGVYGEACLQCLDQMGRLPSEMEVVLPQEKGIDKNSRFHEEERSEKDTHVHRETSFSLGGLTMTSSQLSHASSQLRSTSAGWGIGGFFLVLPLFATFTVSTPISYIDFVPVICGIILLSLSLRMILNRTTQLQQSKQKVGLPLFIFGGIFHLLLGFRYALLQG